MSSIRRRSPESGSPALREASPTSSERSAPRQTSIRLSRRSTGSTPNTSTRSSTLRASANRSQRSTGSGRTAARRAPTPIVPRRRRRTADDDLIQGETDLSASEDDGQQSEGRRQRTVTVNGRIGRDGTNRRVQVTSNSVGDDRMRWYERLMPEFFLNMTAPVTGYESRLESDVEDDEYEILERQRLKRNRRVRRRLLGLIILATAAGFFLYSRGRIFRKAGLKAAVGTMKHRIEGGLAKTIQETMGK